MENNHYKVPDREYFQKLWEHHRSDSVKHTAKVWDSRAREWAQDLKTDSLFQKKLDERVQETTKYLKDQGLLNPDVSIIDIGSGSGRFTVEFAKRAGHVTGIDISPEMLNLGKNYALSEGVFNVSFTECDFKQADIENLGWRKQFDLVFSAMSPATGNMSGLNKMNAMSRGYCFNCSPIEETDELKNKIQKQLFGKYKEQESLWSERYFYSLFNLLWLDGYLPITSYHTQKVSDFVEVNEGLISYYVSHFERQFPNEKNLKQRIYDLLMNNADSNQKILKQSRRLYGWILWDANHKRI